MPSKIRTKVCEYCGKTFTRRMKDSQLFCSRECASEGRHKPKTVPKRRKPREIHICPVCGNKFEFLPSRSKSAKGAGTYCSRKCKGIASRRHEPRPCAICGKIFQPFFNTSKKYCSPKCGAIGLSKNRRNGKMVKCERCGKEFYLPKARLENANHYFCCREHQIKWQGRNKITFICKICGKKFQWSPSRAEQGNPTYCSLECCWKDPEQVERLRKMNLKQQKISPNKLERAGYAILDSLGVEYVAQKMVAGKFAVDAFVPSHNTVIQFDGDYWHGKPDKYADPDYRQRKRMALDKSQDAYMAKCGYSVLRFWGSDIKKHPCSVAQEIATSLHIPPLYEAQ